MGKKVCFNCGASNIDDAKFCVKCGYDLTVDDYSINNDDFVKKSDESSNKMVKVVEETKSIYCSKCGNELNDGTKFCPNCGEPLNGSRQNDDLVKCPNCGSTQISFVRYENNQQYDVCNGICGLAICGPIGLLFGLKNKQEAKTVRKCKKCNHEF